MNKTSLEKEKTAEPLEEPKVNVPDDTSPEVVNEDENVTVEFDKMGLNENILRGIYGYGFERPSLIQSKAIPIIVSGKDIIAQSQSGTGKTGAFTIGTLHHIDDKKSGCQAIILAPTRELASQIRDVCKNLSQYITVKIILAVGGTDINSARRELENGSSIVVGTPGRVIDMIERKYINTRTIKLLVLDEADEMLSEIFEDQIKSIIQKIPRDAQICLFSATIPPAVLSLAKKFMNSPKRILIEQEQLTLEGIQQFYIDAGNGRQNEIENRKYDIFCDIFKVMSISQTMVYVNSKDKADWLRSNLEKDKFTVSVIHGSLSHNDREYIMKDFKTGKTRILISTDLLARGIDIQQVSIVINYDLPNNNECYLHRIGRSGRFGRKGIAINIIGGREFQKKSSLENFYDIEIKPMPEPDSLGEFLN